MGRNSNAGAAITREAVIRRTAELASARGLDGVSVSLIATDLGMSKAGVIGHFRGKSELQVEAFRHAREIFVAQVWEPVRNRRPGMPRLRALCRRWADYAGSPPFAGGCLLVSAAVDFDDQPGPIHDEVASALQAWRATLVGEIERAKQDGDLPARTSARELAYTLEALAARAQPARALIGDTDAAQLCFAAMMHALGRSAR